MKFRVFFRTSRIFAKYPISGVDSIVTLSSLLNSFHEDEIIIICDNTTIEQYKWFASIFPIVYRTKLGNSASFKFCIKLTELHPADIYYFVEDDHLHLPNQKEWLSEGLRFFDFVSLYDHPDKYNESLHVNLYRKIKLTKVGHFASTPSTVMTFACSSQVLTRTKYVLLNEKFTGPDKLVPDDHSMFLALLQEGYTLGTSLPGRSTHCEMNYLSPFIDWDQYAEDIKNSLVFKKLTCRKKIHKGIKL